jgi:hypothetical protein
MPVAVGKRYFCGAQKSPLSKSGFCDIRNTSNAKQIQLPPLKTLLKQQELELQFKIYRALGLCDEKQATAAITAVRGRPTYIFDQQLLKDAVHALAQKAIDDEWTGFNDRLVRELDSAYWEQSAKRGEQPDPWDTGKGKGKKGKGKGKKGSDNIAPYQKDGGSWNNTFTCANTSGVVEEAECPANSCRNFLRTGSCRFGAKCKFSHGVAFIKAGFAPKWQKNQQQQSGGSSSSTDGKPIEKTD